MSSIPDVNWSRISTFVRQHTHDLRNELNGLDLEAALLADLVTDPEALEGVGRIRTGIRKVAADLRGLAAKFSEPRPNLVQLPAQDLFLIWKDQLGEVSGRPEVVEWSSELGEEQVNVDPSVVASAFHELLANAHSFGNGAKIHARATIENDQVVFELREPKVETVDPARWGSTPFLSTRRGGYGLGLCSVVRGVEASGGKITWTFDTGAQELVTRIFFPIHEPSALR
jgi:hypothetical protein